MILTRFAGLIAATAGVLAVGVPRVVLSGLSYALAFGLPLRAVGDSRYVGFFKRVRGSTFATLDTFVYSPLCLLLAAGVALVALLNGTGPALRVAAACGYNQDSLLTVRSLL